VYRAKETVILEDLFGKDQLFLKGHEYVINIDDTETHLYAKGVNYIRPVEKKGYFLSKEQVNKYFEYVEESYLQGGRGNKKLLSFGK
jgi:hypothetical protein